ncbi:hypothetical protein RQP46_010332 [Phenoliferia psychrophenolica]
MHLSSILSGSPLASPAHSPYPRSSVLASPSWASRLALLSTLGATQDESEALRSSHSVVLSVPGHTGCVNTLSWEDGGEGRLISAGDDTKICIWAPGLGQYTSTSSAPAISYNLATTIESGHRANIFAVRFAPGMPQRVISAAGDQQVRIFDLSRTTPSTTVSSGTQKWKHHTKEDAVVRVLRCHSGRVKRIALEDSADVFLTCAEDGEVRQHDLRTTHSCTPSSSSSSACGPPLLSYPGLRLYSLSISKLRPHLFSVAGTSPYTFLHDRRMIRSGLMRDWGVDLVDDGAHLTQCVRRFSVPDSNNPRNCIQNHVVATKLSETRARDLLVSYSGDGVYLFDTDAAPHSPPRARQRRRSSGGADENAKRRKSRNSSPGGSDGASMTMMMMMPLEPIDVAEEPEGGLEDAPMLPNDNKEESQPLSETAEREPKIEDGHANDDTVKDVNFAFGGNMVVSGSDDGNWFVWEKDAEGEKKGEGRLRGIYLGDESVVNVLQPHPRLPLVAISGIDNTIKIFGPVSGPSSSSSNLIANAATIIRRNEGRGLSHNSNFAEGAGQALFNLLARQLPPEAREGVQLMGKSPNGQEVAIKRFNDPAGALHCAHEAAMYQHAQSHRTAYTLTKMINGHPMPRQAFDARALEITLGLHQLHATKMCHGDFKPDNLVAESRTAPIHVIDFGSTDSGGIVATSQQSRFHAATLDSSLEVDLNDINISIGERDLITSSHLRLKQGVRYGLVGRNGSGKSTLLTAIADKLIPGLAPSIRILLLSQVEDSTRATSTADGGATKLTVLEHVVRGDKERLAAVEELEALTRAVESTSMAETQRIVREIRLEKRRKELVEARKVASRRSGTRGKEARMEEIKAEERVAEAEASLAETEVDPEVVAQALEMLQDSQVRVDLLETSTTDARAATILAGLGFTLEMMSSPFTSLSGGWRSRCSLAVSLLVQSDILLLDEPSNFLDLEAIIWLEQFLSSEPRTLVLISHDQEFLANTVEETIILRGKTLRYFEGTPRAFEVNERKERRKLLGQKEALDKKKEHIEASIAKGIASAKKTGDENRQRMVKSRQKKLDERWGTETNSKGTRFKLNRDMAGFHLTSRAELTIEDAESKVKIVISDPDKLRTAGDLIHFDGVEYRFPKAKTSLLQDVTFTVSQGSRIAFVGANGQGKSTLAKLILGQLLPTKGTITRHPSLKIGYFSQHSVEELSSGPAVTPSSPTAAPPTALSHFLEHFEAKGEKVVEQDARACLGSFGLQGKIASDTPLVLLSGGQKVRLAFALLVFHPPPLLLLDEVTTHVDAATTQALAQALKRYSGAIVLITHDRLVLPLSFFPLTQTKLAPIPNRWFSRIVVEGESPRALLLADADDSSDDGGSSSDEDEASGSGKKVGQTWRVGAGKIKLMEKGMVQYVGIVERKLEKRRKAEEAARG